MTTIRTFIFYIVLGGHIELGEPAKSALQRELNEELGVSIDIFSFLGAVEHQWGSETDQHTEINMVFETTIPDSDSKSCLKSKEPHLEFFWASNDKLDAYNLLPTPMVELINAPALHKHACWASTIE